MADEWDDILIDVCLIKNCVCVCVCVCVCACACVCNVWIYYVRLTCGNVGSMWTRLQGPAFMTAWC